MECTINKLKSVEKQINHFCFSPAAFTSALLNLLSHPLKILYYWSFGKYKGSVRPFLTQFKIFDIMCSFYFFLGLRNLVCLWDSEENRGRFCHFSFTPSFSSWPLLCFSCFSALTESERRDEANEAALFPQGPSCFSDVL